MDLCNQPSCSADVFCHAVHTSVSLVIVVVVVVIIIIIIIIISLFEKET